MKFYLIDDDRNIQNILKIIITSRNIGEICGTSSDASEALDDLKFAEPDIVIVDLLMPIMDGITFVKEAKKRYPSLTFVMLSQVSAKDLISSAYESGIEFFIQKPVNSIEVENVLKRVCKQISMERSLSKMQHIFLNEMSDAFQTEPSKNEDVKAHMHKLEDILQKLGIIGEIGSKDILNIVDYMIEHRDVTDDATLTELCSKFSDNPKSMEQRIRRTANAAMINLANLGIEDYSNDVFIEYSNTLFNFEQIRREMDYIRGNVDKGGNVKIRNFLNALVSYCYK